jgi:DegV family protein with EDD domain
VNRRGKIGLCTDSTAQLPRDLVDRYEIEVVPLTICVGEQEYLEGVDLDVDEFYGMFRDGCRPVVSASHPSPGQFAVAYDELAARGCTEILSIHVSAAVSPTLNAARLGARGFELPVRLIDTGTASFGVGCCTWAAAEAIEAGAGIEEAAAVAESLAPSIGNVFTVGALDLLRGQCRVDSSWAPSEGSDEAGTPVLALVDGQVQLLSRVRSVPEAVSVMSAAVCRWDHTVKVGLGIADLSARPFADALQCAVRSLPNVDEVVLYRVGPSVGAHAGPGTVGCFMFPASLARSTPAAS